MVPRAAGGGGSVDEMGVSELLAYVGTCMLKVGEAVSKQCGCQFETHAHATSPGGYLEHQFEMDFSVQLRGQVTFRLLHRRL